MNAPDPDRAASTIPTEARVHQGHEAGIVSRMIAAGVDLAVVTCVLVAGYAAWAVGLFVLDPRAFSTPQPSSSLIGVAYVVVAVACLAIPWSATGHSFGQHVMGLRVTDRGGIRLRPGRAFLRAALCIGFPVGLLWVTFSPSSRALHDLVLHTSVTYDWTTWR